MQLWALAVKRQLNDLDHFLIFEAFFKQYRPDILDAFYIKFKDYRRRIPDVERSLQNLNLHYRVLCRPFDSGAEKDIKDFNYEVDALEDEHIRPDVVTTKVTPLQEKIKVDLKREEEERKRGQQQESIKPVPKKEKGGVSAIKMLYSATHKK